MSFYNPKSTLLYNSKKEVILFSKLPTDVLKNINLDTVDKILNSNIPFYISKVYNIKELDNTSGGEFVFDICSGKVSKQNCRSINTANS